VIVVADSTKLGKVKFAQICTTDAVDLLVTDAATSEDQVAAFERAGVKVWRT
jgi:DeoR family transcriptional regulator, aga operon transcriptional repressor